MEGEEREKKWGLAIAEVRGFWHLWGSGEEMEIKEGMGYRSKG